MGETWRRRQVFPVRYSLIEKKGVWIRQGKRRNLPASCGVYVDFNEPKAYLKSGFFVEKTSKQASSLNLSLQIG
jgi:hypothetical protein